MRLLLILFLWQISCNSFAKEANTGSDYGTAAELQMLPKFCQDRFRYGGSSKEFLKWKTMLGPESLHVHHYCQGLLELQRYPLVKKHKQGVLDSARANFNYTLTRVKNPRFVLLPDLYYRLALISKEEGNSSEAISLANKSIQAKKSYLNPYILLSDIYMKSGNKTEAKRILLEAKKYNPNSKKLKKRLKKIE